MPSSIEVLIHEVREGLTSRLDAISGRLDDSLKSQMEIRETIGRIEARQQDTVEHLGRINGQLLTHAEKIEMLNAFRERHQFECPMGPRVAAVEEFVQIARTKKGMWKSEFTYFWALLLVILGGIMGPIGEHFKEAWFSSSGSQSTSVSTQTTTHTTDSRK